jgi:uncharacterized protein (DUF2267 family)
MDELVKLVAQKTGLSEDKAKVAVETVLGSVKDRLPAPVAGQIDSILGGEEGAPGLGGVAQSLGGMFGKKG